MVVFTTKHLTLDNFLTQLVLRSATVVFSLDQVSHADLFVRSEFMRRLFEDLRNGPRAYPRFRPVVEALEDRTLLAGGFPQATADVDFTIGRMVADGVRDVVYVADQTNARILAVDTDLGRTVSRRDLAGAPGALAVSIESDRLFIAEPGAFQIEVLSLPALTPVTTLSVGIAVYNLVAVANDRLVVSSSASFSWTDLDVLNAQTGQVLANINRGVYYSPLLRTNANGTKLYVRQTSLSGPDTNIDEYDVRRGGPISLTDGYPAPLANSLDFLVDESARRIYTSDGGVYGVGVTNMDTKATAVWSFGGSPYGIAVAALPTGPIYGASYDGIFQFDAGGTVRAQYPTPGRVMAESLKITPNGHLLYGSDSGSVLGILGASSLVIEDRPVAQFTFVPQTDGRVFFDASNSSGGLSNGTPSFTWDFGDGTSGSGATITHAYIVSGQFAVKLTVTNAAGQSDELTLFVPVFEIRPVAQFTFVPQTDGRVFFDASNSSGGLTNETPNFTWDFGDGTTGDGVRITHAFNVSGLFTVKLTVTNTAGQTDVLSQFVPVTTGSIDNSISGKVFHDFDGHDLNGLPLKGRTVYLDTNNNGRLDRGDIQAITVADGSYAFAELKPGETFHVRVVVPKGWVATTATRIDVTVGTGIGATGNDFGIGMPASFSGMVFDDSNIDGRKGRGEGGLRRWTVVLDVNANGVLDPGEARARTNADGRYTFKGLVPGTYIVRPLVKVGWETLLPLRTIALTGGESAAGQNFPSISRGKVR